MGAGVAADLTALEMVTEEIRDGLTPDCVSVNKSTVPVGTARHAADVLGATTSAW
jgi:UDPglucose 6-dehydrogenase